MSPNRPGADQERLTLLLLQLLGADSVQRVLDEAVALMASIVDSTAAAAFTIEAEQVLEEAWHPGVDVAGEPVGRQLRSFALQSVRSGEPLSLPPRGCGGRDPGGAAARGASHGAVALWSKPHVSRPPRRRRSSSCSRLVAEAVPPAARCRDTGHVEQQKRWFGQLDSQVRVLDGRQVRGHRQPGRPLRLRRRSHEHRALGEPP
jgi:hypothetical protein